MSGQLDAPEQGKIGAASVVLVVQCNLPSFESNYLSSLLINHLFTSAILKYRITIPLFVIVICVKLNRCPKKMYVDCK